MPVLTGRWAKALIDGGKTWSYVPVVDYEEAYGISSISISPASPNTVYASIFFFSGSKGLIVKSTDAGSRYDSVLELPVPVNCIAVHPYNPEIIYAGTGNFHPPVTPGTVYKSTNGGTSWSKTTTLKAVVNSIALHFSDPDTLFIGCGAYDYSYGGIFKSTDGAATWVKKSGGLPDNGKARFGVPGPSFAVTAIKNSTAHRSTMYAALYDGGIYISLDEGNYWSRVGLSDKFTYALGIRNIKPAGILQSNRQNSCSTVPASSLIAGTSSGLYQYTTSGSGVLSGTIVCADTGMLIDSATVSTSHSGYCKSIDGYYLLLLPEGLHSITAQTPGYIPATHPGVQISAGQQSTRDIVLLPIQDDSTNCLASHLLPESTHGHVLTALKVYRDNLLCKTIHGNELIAVYYKLGYRLFKQLRKNQGLRQRCMHTLTKLITENRPLAFDTPMKISVHITKDIDCLLDELHKISTGSLPSEIKLLWERIKSGAYADVVKVINHSDVSDEHATKKHVHGQR